jgi:hypothetical protein
VRRLAARGAPAAKLAKARKLLTDAPVQATVDMDVSSLTWSAPKDRGTMDRLRIQMLDQLAELK